MLKIDLVIGGVIGAAILFSILGVATYERTGGSVTYEASFPAADRNVQGPAPPPSLVGNGAVEANVPVPHDNLTKLTLDVAVLGRGPRTQPVMIAIRITSPEGNNTDCTGGTMPAGQGPATVPGKCEVALAAAPASVEIQADSNETAMNELAGKYNRTAGKGTWKVTVTVTGNPAPPVVPVPGQAYETYTVTITGKATTYAAAVMPKTPDFNR
ncbi:MAG TPA: hypothetical protein VI818_00915 [Candidatus Thermoplasmatota archaeon]|nr:hypothetical protein [Candidatus Thermoplasmatota archaeon]